LNHDFGSSCRRILELIRKLVEVGAVEEVGPRLTSAVSIRNIVGLPAPMLTELTVWYRAVPAQDPCPEDAGVLGDDLHGRPER